MKIMSPADRPGAVEIDLQVVFGSPSRSCAGSGVCKMLPQSFKVPEYWRCQAWPARLRYYGDGKMVLDCSLARMPAQQFILYFSGVSFLLEEEYHLPLWLSSRLGKSQLFLPAGKYQFTIEQSLIITFQSHELKNWQRIAADATARYG